MSDMLQVRHGAHIVGTLYDDGGRFSFCYDDTWRAGGWPISCALPLDTAGGEGHAFFAQLSTTPGAAVTHLAAQGHDLFGALACHTTPPAEHPLTCNTLTGTHSVRLTEHPHRFLTGGDTPATHWLTHAHGDQPVRAAYAHDLARHLGLPVTDSQLQRTDTGWALLSRRTDCDENGARLHAETLRQALGLSPPRPDTTLGSVARLLRHHTLQPVTDLCALVQWQVFNALIGNDHNALHHLALRRAGDGWRLAPFAHFTATPGTTHLPLPVGSNHDPHQLGDADWQALAHDTGVNRKLIRRLLREQAAQLLDQLDSWHLAFNQQHDTAAETQPVRDLLRRQYRKALRDWLR